MNLPRLAINRPIFIVALMLLLISGGILSMTKIGVDLFPDVNFPVVIIQTPYPGASPNDVENSVTKIIEEEIGNLSNLKKMSSSSRESISVVVTEFNLKTDIKDAEQQIRNRIANLKNKLPAEIKEPIIGRVDPADLPIVRFAIKSELKRSLLYDIIKDHIASEFERIEGVGKVEIVGGRKREIQVLVDKNKMEERSLSILQIADSIASSSKNIPLGKTEQNKQETIYRSVGEFSSIESIKEVVLNYVDKPIHLSSIAKVIDGEEDEKNYSTLNGKTAVFVDVYKQSGNNTAAVAMQVIKRVEKINQKLKSLGVEANVSLVRNSAKFIKMSVDDVKESILIGIVLCIIIVFIFLGSIRSTIITGLAIPTALLGAFILMYAVGFTINMMTLLALSLAVGLLIDDAIVVRENIFRHLQTGTEPRKAALKGTLEVTLAVIATSAVVISVFGPIAFLDGIVGQFFKQFGLTIVFVILISTLDAMTVAPMLSAYWATSNQHHGILGKISSSFEKFQEVLDRLYEKAITFTLRNRKKVIAFALVIFIASLAIIPLLPSTFVPNEDYGEFAVRLELPPSASLQATKEAAAIIDKKLLENKDVETTAATIGTSAGTQNIALIYVKLHNKGVRKLSTMATKDYFRKELPELVPGAAIRVQYYDEFGDTGERPFMIFFEGDNLEELTQYAEKVKQRFTKIEGLIELDTNYRQGRAEYQVIFNRKVAEERGVSLTQAGAELRARLDGIIASSYRDNNKEYDIRVELDEGFKDLQKNFSSTEIPNKSGNFISLKNIATLKSVPGFSQINRLNKGRYISVTGDIGTSGALGNVVEESKKILMEELKPPLGITWSFQGMAEDFQDLIKNMLIAIIFAVVLIFLVLSSLYDSFITPFSILLALPMAVCGALFALWITGEGINVFSLIGFILLLGIVAKNSILLVDYTIHKMNDEGMERNQALILACKTRLRPILMTSIALIAGTIPVAIGLSEVSSSRTSMGIAIIGGLISSTFLTLLIVPAAFGYIDDFRLWCYRLAVKGK
ncbi:MAG: efflux RND transporter permease subunit [Oligoflexia bacterium]|nr:efflux RND transporter permease subunit [Oligoflexia bacterium]MBF0366776.1 efflux RND transporter permease subunit [Oligoflexia bacterium]